MTYPQQGQPGDPYGQPQHSQPPADGYAPGQVGPGYGAQPPQYPPPDGGQGGYTPQPGYGPQPGQPDAYGQYGPPMPPPVAPTSKGGAGTAVLIVVVLILMVGGGVAGYLLLGGEDEGTTTASDDSSTSAEATPEGDGETSEGTEDEGDGGEEPTAPAGDALTVESLGATTPAPGAPWEYSMGPGETGIISEDASAHYIQHENNWISYMEVGLATNLYAPYDPADLKGSALAALDAWTHGPAFSSAEGVAVTDPVITDVEVDGHPAVMAQATVSWTASANTSDTYEDVTVLLVDVDGVNGFIGLASVPESGTDAKQAAIDALLATTFGSQTA